MKSKKLKSEFIIIFSLIAGIHLTCAISGSSQEDTYPFFEIPVFQGGYNIIKGFDPLRGIKTISYNVRMNYPAAEIIEFYDSFFNGSGWISSFEICQRHWAVPADGSKDAEPAARQMFTAWVHPKLDLNVVLWLKYESINNPRRNEVIVEGRLQSKAEK